MARRQWIEKRSYQLWKNAGEPKDRSVEFWLKAEHEHDHGYQGRICVLSADHCPYQTTQATTGGRHISLCNRQAGNCPHRASNN